MPPNIYTSVSSVKALLPDVTWTTKYDTLFTTLISRASRHVDNLLKRKPGAFSVSALETRYFDGNGARRLLVGEMAAAPTVVAVAETGIVDGANGSGGTYTVWANTDYYPGPQNRLEEGKPYLHLELNTFGGGNKATWYKFPRAVKVTAYFGFATTAALPPEIQEATEIQVVRWWKRGQQAFQDAGAISELNQLRYVKEMDPDIKQILMNVEKFAWF